MPLSARAECIAIWRTLKDAQRGSTLVFSGTVTASDSGVLVSFEVDRVWKGRVMRHMTLVVMPGVEVKDATYFKTGETYVVFANLSGHTTPDIKGVPAGTAIYDISYCSPTAPVTSFGKEIEQLGRAKPPRADR